MYSCVASGGAASDHEVIKVLNKNIDDFNNLANEHLRNNLSFTCDEATELSYRLVSANVDSPKANLEGVPEMLDGTNNEFGRSDSFATIVAAMTNEHLLDDSDEVGNNINSEAGDANNLIGSFLFGNMFNVEDYGVSSNGVYDGETDDDDGTDSTYTMTPYLSNSFDLDDLFYDSEDEFDEFEQFEADADAVDDEEVVDIMDEIAAVIIKPKRRLFR